MLTIDMILALSEDELRARFTDEQLIGCINDGIDRVRDPGGRLWDIEPTIPGATAVAVELHRRWYQAD